jgi:uncharacterized protein with NRDE domain
MCTLSIIPHQGQLIVTMNRDERRDRPQSNDMRVTKDVAYPYDIQRGGTWFGINRHGLVVALLNHYEGPHHSPAPSRGRFIPELLSARNIDEAMEKFAELHSKDDNPFNLVLTSGDRIVHARWDGTRLDIKSHDVKTPFFLTTSSEYTATALALRQKLFNEFLQNRPANDRDATAIVRDLHLRSVAGQENISIFMQREKRHTKSITQAVLSSAGVTATYYPEGQLSSIAAHRQSLDFNKIPVSKAQFKFQKRPAASLRKRPHV